MRNALGTGSNPVWKFCPGILRSLPIIVLLTVTGALTASAGELVVYNLSNRPVTCSVDRYTKASGADADLPFRVDPGQKLNIPPSFASKDHALNFIDCGGLRTRAMNLTPESPDRVIFLNGHQRRVLNALLYASIPTDPKIGFTPLERWLTQSYQAAHPEILLNLVLDPAIDVYSFGNLKDAVFSTKGFDVAELDTVFLKWLKDTGLIIPARITGEEPWPVARQAVMIGGQAYGVPSWLCSDFLFSTGSDVQGIKTSLTCSHTWRRLRRAAERWWATSTAPGQSPPPTYRPSCRVTRRRRQPMP